MSYGQALLALLCSGYLALLLSDFFHVLLVRRSSSADVGRETQWHGDQDRNIASCGDALLRVVKLWAAVSHSRT